MKVHFGANEFGDSAGVAAPKDRLYEALNERLVGIGFIAIGDLGRAVDHRAPGWIGRLRGLKVVPVFGDLAVFDAKNVECDEGRAPNAAALSYVL